MQKVVLLNPPGDQRYFRDYYCSKVSKADYYYNPVDLVYLSGRFDSKRYKLMVIDAIAERLSNEECLKRINGFSPDIIISLFSAPSYDLDRVFLKRTKDANPNSIMMVAGDYVREKREKTFSEFDFIDAIFVDFSTDDVIKYIEREADVKIENIIYKSKGKIYAGEERHKAGVWNVPMPRWDLFKIEKYSFPFQRRRKFASVLNDFGCPHRCSFCPIKTVGFKLRPADDVINELKLLKGKGVNEIFFRDQTFGVNSERTAEFCNKMVSEKLNMSWTCFSRVDTVDENLLPLMKKAGCHTIMFGIESVDEELLKKYKKGITPSQVEKCITLCRKNGIRTLGTFILGLPGDDRNKIERTIRFAKKLHLDYASFNIAAPKFGTELRKDAIQDKIIDDDVKDVESTYREPVWKNQNLTNEEILRLKKRAVREFYFRPTYLLRRLAGIRSLTELKADIVEGLSLLKKNV